MRSQLQIPPVSFSIILPSFNRAHTLTRAIESVRNQSIQSWELIIIDDGSTDSTAHLVHRAMAEDHRIHYLLQENQGVSAARNYGMSQARGEYLAFLDSDDTLDANHLQVRLTAFREQAGIDFIYGGAKIIGNPMVVDQHNPSQVISLEDEAVKICGTFCVRTRAALRIGGFARISYGEDGEFFARAVNCGLRTFRTKHKTYNYDRTSPDSICTQLLARAD